jgi:hypothetical protein
MPKCCGVVNGPYICDREPGHAGLHRGYCDIVDAPLFWQQSSVEDRTICCPQCGHVLVNIHANANGRSLEPDTDSTTPRTPVDVVGP